VDKSVCPEKLGPPRSKDQSLKVIDRIKSMTSKSDKKIACTQYGLHDRHNPLFKLHLDLHRLVLKSLHPNSNDASSTLQKSPCGNSSYNSLGSSKVFVARINGQA